MNKDTIKLIGKGILERDVKWWFRKGIVVTSHPGATMQRINYQIRQVVADQLLARIGYYNYPYHIIFLAGMGMGGTTWMKNLLGRIPGYFTRANPMPKDVRYNCNICDSAFSFVPKHGYTLFKTHLISNQDNLDCIMRNGVEKILVTYRDFRDVALSRCHRLIQIPKPRNALDFVDYQAMSFERALDHSLEIVAQVYVPWIRNWRKFAEKQPKCFHFITFEDLKADTKGTFKGALDFYGISLTSEKIDQIVKQSKGRGGMRKNLTAAEILPWGVSSNFRSGKIGDWKNEYSEANIEKAKQLLGPGLIEFGYEMDLNWSLE